jgi:nucleoside-triphosphatase THEP1
MMLFLWTGPRHSGKTTRAAKLAGMVEQSGFRVAGLLAPSVYQDGFLTGFDALDLRSQARAPLAVRRDEPGDVGSFHFLAEGLKLGARALDVAAAEGADLVIVDEFGPLELASQGWRRAVDSLVQAGKAPLLIVVRRELVDAIQEIYADVPGRVLDATARESILEVLGWLERRSQIVNHNS